MKGVCTEPRTTSGIRDSTVKPEISCFFQHTTKLAEPLTLNCASESPGGLVKPLLDPTPRASYLAAWCGSGEQCSSANALLSLLVPGLHFEHR